MKILAWLAAAAAAASLLFAASPFIYALLTNDESYINAGWPLLFFTTPAALLGCGLAALLAIIACSIAIARGAKTSGISAIVALIGAPLIAVGSVIIPTTWSKFLPFGLLLAVLVFAAGFAAAIVATQKARPTLPKTAA